MSNWIAGTLPGIEHRIYADYEAYLNHQRAKLATLDAAGLVEHDGKYHDLLLGRLQEHGIVKPGMSVLCLGARTGGEVRAFWDFGCFSVGIDINPGESNPCVIVGDFHELEFPKDSVDAIFTNSLDHIYDLDKVIFEIKRVLKPMGLLILEIVCGTKEGQAPGKYESYSWQRTDDILAAFRIDGFELLSRTDACLPWRMQHIYLQLVRRRGAAESASVG